MMDKEEMEPMMQKEEQKQHEDREYHEQRTRCCGSCTLKCMIITFCIFLIYQLFAELFELYKIGTNKYFEPIYLWVSIGLVFIIFVAVILASYYLFAKDSRESRAVLPWAFLIAGIASILISLWVMYYIFFMYPKKDVLVTGFDDNHNSKR